MAALLAAFPSVAAAQEMNLAPTPDTQVASAFDKDDPFDVHATVEYEYTSRTAQIKRELAGNAGISAEDPLPLGRDLVLEESRHVIVPRLALGVFRDLEVFAALPVVVDQQRHYEFDQGVDATNSTTIRDGLLPGGGASDGLGFDAEDPGTNFAASSDTVFRSVGRSGLDQLHLGVNYAIANQARDPDRPTWFVGAELRLSIGDIARFDRVNPSAETGVSHGVHEVQVTTGFSRLVGWAEPYLLLWWRAPVATRGDTPEDPDDSLFWDVGFGQGTKRPRQRAGVAFGFEAILWSRPEQEQQLGLQFRGRTDATFEGRGYSEMWEPFAYAGDRATNPDGPLVLDRDPTFTSDEALSHPGLTKIENHLTFAGALGLSGKLGAHARFDTWFEATRQQRHRISFSDAGQEGSDEDTVITPGTAEVNPLHVRAIDIVGRRYVVDDSTAYTVHVAASLLF